MAAGRVAVKNDCIAVYLVASPVLLAHAAAAAAHEIVDLNLAAHAHAHDLLRLPAQLAHRGAIWRDSASAAAPPRATPSHLSTARSGQSSAGVGGAATATNPRRRARACPRRWSLACDCLSQRRAGAVAESYWARGERWNVDGMLVRTGLDSSSSSRRPCRLLRRLRPRAARPASPGQRRP